MDTVPIAIPWEHASRATPPDPEAFALGILEFDKVRQRLAGFCACHLGAERAYATVPVIEAGVIEHLLIETEEAESFLGREETTLSAAGLNDMRPEVKLAGKGGGLSMAALYHIGRLCQITNQIKHALEHTAGKYPALSGYAAVLSFTNQVANRCEATFENEETIRDTATPQLKSIRRNLQEQQGHIHDRAQRLASKLYQDSILTTPSFTLRNGRYVLPFQSGAMGKVTAIIQGTSESGATIWAEPSELVEANNKLAQLRLEEEQEVERILTELSTLVGHHAQAIVTNIEIAAQLDCIMARAKLARSMSATRPMVGGTEIRLIQARHPLIAKDRVVASDIVYGGTQRGLIITGPNAGGKTVALKALGLLACMAQSGMFIPAKPGSALPRFGAVLAEIGDQQSIEMDLSSFSAHVTYLQRCLKFVHALESSDTKPLILLDEIGRATDPQEGSAIALALTEVFIRAGAYFAITTHLPALKNLVIGGHPNIVGGAVQFDVDKLEPEYRLQIPGVGASYAIVVTEKMGLDPEVLERAKQFVGKQFRLLELEIPALEKKKARLEYEMGQIEGRWIAQDRKEKHQLTLLLAMQQYTFALLEETIEQCKDLLKDARKKVARLAQQSSQASSSQAAVQQEAETEVQRLGQLRKDLEQQQRGLARATAHPEVAIDEPDATPLEIGDRVWVPLLKREGELIGFKKGGSVAEVSLDGKRMTMDAAQLQRATGGTAAKPREPRTSYDVERPKDIPLWLDLHGVRVEAGLEKVEDFLQGAYLQQRDSAQIMHGVGTLALRSAIWKYLQRHPLVRSFKEADPAEGGAGVTIVTFRE